ncbi:PTS fructose transporter subunit IIC [Patulibacter sp.]|uniref:PTS fructose transporter subunit IIC n=1 Tax=Patulibacter sp. TaxID=1912859 RepID=UPI00271C1351|nr:PTS fructose transporter subunit IIBC [Patulibacter sp.]MDO9408123.1 PTS fructose transporter subunit IIBC [Patulibacter sp.]
MRIVAITACPTGIAHTYMAAESLEVAAKAAGHEIVVETQGSAGSTPLSAEELQNADVAIFAADIGVKGRERFAHLPIVEGPVKRGINDAQGMLSEAQAAVDAKPAVDPAAKLDTSGKLPANPGMASVVAPGYKPGPGALLRTWLMTGVSYMIPFVAAGGLLIAIAFLIGGPEIASKVNGGTFDGQTYKEIADITDIWGQVGIAGVLFKIGTTAFSMLVPILAGYIAYGMADRQGLVPGIVGGLLAVSINAGFLGGLIAGLLAGAVVLAINRIPVHKNVRGIMPTVIVPLVSVTIVGILMIAVVGSPIASLMGTITDWLEGLNGTSAWLLGGLLGLMMAVDMGGPINKVAYTFGVASLASGNQEVMGAVIAAGMTPPLALALSTVVAKKLWTTEEREAGKAAWLLGASFITEGAIPFAAADPLRVIPSMMAGSATAGALSMAFSASSPAPHGGIWIIALIGTPGLWLVAILAGTAVSAVCVTFAKTVGRQPAAKADAQAATAAAGAPSLTTVAG